VPKAASRWLLAVSLSKVADDYGRLVSDIVESPKTSPDRLRRAARIALDRDSGLTWDEIARRHGLSSRHARRLAGEVAGPSIAAPAVIAISSTDLVARVIATLQAALDGCLRIAAEDVGRNQRAVTVGALRSASKIAMDLLDVSERVGLTPPGQDAWKWTRQVDHAARRLIELAERNGIDVPKLIREIEADEVLAMAVATAGPLR
jgi:hypothetical protein